MTLTDILSVVFGSGGLGLFVGTYIMFYKEKKRKAAAEANSAEIHNEQTEVDRLETRLKVRDDKIDIMYVDYRKLQADYIDLIKRYNTIELQLKEAEFRRCDTRGCANRIPPNDF